MLAGAIALLVLCAAPIPAQMVAGQLTVYSAPAVYNNPMYDSLSLLEFPFVLNRSELEFFRADSADSSYYGRVFAQVVLVSDQNIPIDSTNTYFSVRVDSLSQAAVPDYRLFNKLAMKVKPGRYTAHLTVIDAVSKKSKDLFFGSFVVAAPSKEHLKLSTPVLAFKIQYVGNNDSSGNDRMIRNGFLILNNPIGVFEEKDSTGYVYSELYGLKAGDKAHGSFKVGYQLLDSTLGMVRNFGFKLKEKPGSSAALSDVLDLSGLRGGRYDLRITADDPSSGEADTAQVPVIIFAPPKQTFSSAAPDSADPWLQLSLQEKINCTHWFLTPNQQELLDRLTDVGKANFLTQFWRENNVERDNRILSSNANQASTRTETVKRFLYANQWFSRNLKKTDGWTSDRGRVYMIYGPYDTHKEVPAPRTGDPFVIWSYNTYKEGKIFVFQDVHGDGDYRLVHSNVNGEIYNQDWADRLQEELMDIQ